jgi:hypothetical protein
MADLFTDAALTLNTHDAVEVSSAIVVADMLRCQWITDYPAAPDFNTGGHSAGHGATPRFCPLSPCSHFEAITLNRKSSSCRNESIRLKLGLTNF